MLREQKDWQLTARYLYTLSLGGPCWAWEWLRRNEDYQADWQREQRARRRRRRATTGSGRALKDRAKPWGLMVMENPEIPARDAMVFWRSEFVTGLLRAGQQVRAADTTLPFSLWSEPGRKAIAIGPDGAQVIIQAAGGSHRLLFEAPDDLSEPMDLELRLDAPDGNRDQFEAARRFLFERQGDRARTLPVHPRAPLMMQMLQVADGRALGASQREIAEVLFGTDEVAAEWAVSDRLKSRIRYLERRGTVFIQGGYRVFLRPPVHR